MLNLKLYLMGIFSYEITKKQNWSIRYIAGVDFTGDVVLQLND